MQEEVTPLHFVSSFTQSYPEAITQAKGYSKLWRPFIQQLGIFHLCVGGSFTYTVCRMMQAKHKKMLSQWALWYQCVWDDASPLIFDRLHQAIGPTNQPSLKAHVCITPLYTRAPRRREFLIAPGMERHRMLEVAFHELLHFQIDSLKPDKPTSDPDEHAVDEFLVETVLAHVFPGWFRDVPYRSYVRSDACNLPDVLPYQAFFSGQIPYGQILQSYRQERTFDA